MIIKLDEMQWYQRIKLLRAIKGWSQEEAAVACNTRQKTYWDWEKGKRFPHKNNRIAIARAFEVTESEIFGWEQQAVNE